MAQLSFEAERCDLLREATERGIASMNADDKALRNALVYMQNNPEVTRFRFSVK
jgi:hypothetical protein